MSNSMVDAILSDPEVAKLNLEIKKILDSLTAYYRVVDTSDEDIAGIENSISLSSPEPSRHPKDCCSKTDRLSFSRSP